jgi:hypothetical protein
MSGQSSPFASSRGSTIGLIVAGVVAVGALGGLAGAVFNDDAKLSPPKGGPGVVIQPGADGDTDGGTDGGTDGATDGGGGILDPDPVGSAEPSPGGSESTEGSSDGPSIAPSDGSNSLAGGIDLGSDEQNVVTIGNGVQVPVLDGWEVVGQGDVDVLLGDGQNTFVYAITGTVDPSTDAASVIAASLEGILPQQAYTQLEKTDIAPLQSFGSVVSMAGMQYRAIWTDQQASVPLQGLLICAVRQDGTAIIMTAEHAPPEEFEQSVDAWAPVVNGTLTLFGGV